MRNRIIDIVFILFGLFTIQGKAQEIKFPIDSLIIDTFYIASKDDTASFNDGWVDPLKEGSITYRIYIELAEGVKLKSVFGEVGHAIHFSSTEDFFNNTDWGKNYGFEIKKNKFNESTSFLDSWLTLNYASDRHYGVLKGEDGDGAIDEIVNNDDGVLQNNTPEMGKPLYTADGLLEIPDGEKIEFAFTDIDNHYDEQGTFIETRTSVLRDQIIGSDFKSSYFFIKPSGEGGIAGPTTTNRILLAQLTTAGTLDTINLNISVILPDGRTITYYGDTTSLNGAKFSPWLHYPWDFSSFYGCTDPNSIEYDPNAKYDNGTCKNPVIFGCMDEKACNYDSQANKKMNSLCCYDSNCALELGIVCPGTIYGCMDTTAVNFNPEANAHMAKECIYCHTSRIGCMDDDYLEYNSFACFQTESSCKTLKIEGCLNKKACNYNPVANSDAECTFDCINDNTKSAKSGFQLQNNEILIYPQPSHSSVTYCFSQEIASLVFVEITDIYGKSVYKREIGIVEGEYCDEVNLDGFAGGTYFIRVDCSSHKFSKTFLIE